MGAGRHLARVARTRRIFSQPGARYQGVRARSRTRGISQMTMYGRRSYPWRTVTLATAAVSTGQFADGDLVGVASAFDAAVPGGGQVAVPVGVGGCSRLGGEDVDD